MYSYEKQDMTYHVFLLWSSNIMPCLFRYYHSCLCTNFFLYREIAIFLFSLSFYVTTCGKCNEFHLFRIAARRKFQYPIEMKCGESDKCGYRRRYPSFQHRNAVPSGFSGRVEHAGTLHACSRIVVEVVGTEKSGRRASLAAAETRHGGCLHVKYESVAFASLYINNVFK